MEEKQCEQCNKIKNVENFRKVTNMYTSVHYMSICKDCYNHNQKKARRECEERQKQWGIDNAEKLEARRRFQERQKRWEEGREEREEQSRLYEGAKEIWYSQQPERQCISCLRVLSAQNFGYSVARKADADVGNWIPELLWIPQLHTRCKECHETYRKASKVVHPICQLCGKQRSRHEFLKEFKGYKLDLIKICCRQCQPQFEMLSHNEQLDLLHRAMIAEYGEKAYIYCLHYDEDNEHHNHIGRTKHLKRRMGEYRRNWHTEISHYHVLEEVSFGPLSMERESLWMMHAIKESWPIDNFELLKGDEDGLSGIRLQAKIAEDVQSFEPLTASWNVVMPIVRKFLGTRDAEIVRWFLECKAK